MSTAISRRSVCLTPLQRLPPPSPRPLPTIPAPDLIGRRGRRAGFFLSPSSPPSPPHYRVTSYSLLYFIFPLPSRFFFSYFFVMVIIVIIFENVVVIINSIIKFRILYVMILKITLTLKILLVLTIIT